MAAEQAEVVGQDVTVERVAQLRAERTTTNPAGQATEDGPRYRTEGDTNRASESANQRTCLAASQCSADATHSTAHGADGCADFHGVMEGRDFG